MMVKTWNSAIATKVIFAVKTMKKQDTFSYKGWLISDNFVKRCFASLGYQTMATLIIYGAFLVIAIVFGGLAWIIGALL